MPKVYEVITARVLNMLSQPDPLAASLESPECLWRPAPSQPGHRHPLRWSELVPPLDAELQHSRRPDFQAGLGSWWVRPQG